MKIFILSMATFMATDGIVDLIWGRGYSWITFAGFVGGAIVGVLGTSEPEKQP